jgi:hypothetical protein
MNKVSEAYLDGYSYGRGLTDFEKTHLREEKDFLDFVTGLRHGRKAIEIEKQHSQLMKYEKTLNLDSSF